MAVRKAAAPAPRKPTHHAPTHSGLSVVSSVLQGEECGVSVPYPRSPASALPSLWGPRGCPPVRPRRAGAGAERARESRARCLLQSSVQGRRPVPSPCAQGPRRTGVFPDLGLSALCDTPAACRLGCPPEFSDSF